MDRVTNQLPSLFLTGLGIQEVNSQSTDLVPSAEDPREAGGDFAELCSRSGLGDYRTFRRHNTAEKTGATVRAVRRETVSDPPNHLSPVPSRHVISDPSEKPRWHALRSILQAGPVEVEEGHENDRASRRLPSGSVSIVASGGGAGVSTILATLGRLFATRNERVLLVDGAPASVLPFYFGAATPISGSCVFRERLNSTDQSIRVVSRKLSAAPDHSDGPEPDQPLWATVESLLHDVDRLLVDCWAGMTQDIHRKLLLESNSLVILVPDLRSMVRIRALIEGFQDRERECGRNITPHFLINQFDPTVPLHQDLQRSLAGQLGERLLPFTLRRTDEVACALAEGTTVVDYAPHSGIAEDFLQLADWLAMWQGTQPESRSCRAGAVA
jgi:cellulose biosynthesis protein BcsQ